MVVVSWRDEAACRGADVDEFFPERGDSLLAARRLCAGCTVRDECLEFALTHSIKFGVWGGLSERERRGIRRVAAPRCKRCRRSVPGGARNALCPECSEVARKRGLRNRPLRPTTSWCPVCSGPLAAIGEPTCRDWVCVRIWDRRQRAALLVEEEAS